MSYDLFLGPRSGTLSPERFLEWFAVRSHYKIEGKQAWYRNEDTGVYFSFEDASGGEEPPPLPFQFNVNYFRPRGFILEAEPEVTAAIRGLDLVASDPQVDGMGDAGYDPVALVRGWDKGNAFAMKAFAEQAGGQRPHAMPAAQLERIWRWNHSRKARQAAVAEDQFVPMVMFFERDGRLATGVAWPDGIPAVLPKVDYLAIGRDRLAPRKLLFRKKGLVWVEWTRLAPLLERYRVEGRDEFNLDYRRCPREIADLVRGLEETSPTISRVGFDHVLEQEALAATTT